MNNSIGNLRNKLTIEYGGVSKKKLLESLKQSGVMLNEFSEIIFSSKNFKTSKRKQLISVKEISINELGFLNGATMSEIKECLVNFGLSECPLEVAPYLRLEFLNQEDVKVDHEKNKAPKGSITIFSNSICGDDDFPKGFYLRKMDGQLWLRGYRCSLDYIWSPNDCFVFRVLE